MNNILTYAFLWSRWERVVWRARTMVSSIDLFSLYANCSEFSKSRRDGFD